MLRRRVEDGTELVVLTLWESMEAVRRFAGPDPDKAVVEPEAQAVLTSFDDYVTHFEVVDSMADPQIPDAEFKREAPDKGPAVSTSAIQLSARKEQRFHSTDDHSS